MGCLTSGWPCICKCKQTRSLRSPILFKMYEMIDSSYSIRVWFLKKKCWILCGFFFIWRLLKRQVSIIIKSSAISHYEQILEIYKIILDILYPGTKDKTFSNKRHHFLIDNNYLIENQKLNTAKCLSLRIQHGKRAAYQSKDNIRTTRRSSDVC